MDNNTFVFKIWKLVATCLCVLIISVSGCTTLKNYKVAEAVNNGVDPIAARCMYLQAVEDVSICTAYILSNKNDKNSRP